MWVSSSALACRCARGGGASLSLIVTAGGAPGGVSASVSYAVPGVAVVRGGNVPTAGVRGVAVGVVGGGRMWSAGGRVGGSACEGSAWVSESSLRCRAAAGGGGSRSVSVTFALQVRGLISRNVFITWF